MGNAVHGSVADEGNVLLARVEQALRGGDAATLRAALAALLATLESRPMDEPPLPGGLAERADALLSLIAADGARANADAAPERAALLRAHANVLRLLGPGADGRARTRFAQAFAVDGGNGATWFDFGLLHKWRGRWKEAAECFERALALGVDHRGTHWNLAVVRTALADAQGAAAAWKRVGVETTPGKHLVEVPGLPPARVRVPAQGAGYKGEPIDSRAARFELPWVHPFSPCHGVLVSPTFGRAAVDCGDVVLWDGAPAAVADEDGEPVPRFVLLEVLRRWDGKRLAFVTTAPPERLDAAFPGGTTVFLERPRLESVIARGEHGSASAPGTGQESTLAATSGAAGEAVASRGVAARRGKLVVPADVSLHDVVHAVRGLRADGVAIAIPELFEALGDTQEAGKQHRAWLALDRARDLDA